MADNITFVGAAICPGDQIRVGVVAMLSVISKPMSSIHRPVMKWKVMPFCRMVRSPGLSEQIRSPVGRVGQADGVTGAVVRDDVVLPQDLEEGDRDVLAEVPLPGHVQPGLHPLEHRLLGVDELLRWLAQQDPPATRHANDTGPHVGLARTRGMVRQ